MTDMDEMERTRLAMQALVERKKRDATIEKCVRAIENNVTYDSEWVWAPDAIAAIRALKDE